MNDYFDYIDDVDYFLSESEDPLIRCVTLSQQWNMGFP